MEDFSYVPLAGYGKHARESVGIGFRTEAEAIVELFLNKMEDDRDNLLLREMNGRHCAKLQVKSMAIAAKEGRSRHGKD